jgi:hypothetical protein
MLFPPSLDECYLQGSKIGLPPGEAKKFWLFYSMKGWKVGKAPMVSWTHAIALWKENWLERTTMQIKTDRMRDLRKDVEDED